MRLTTVELCAGAGGQALGIQQAGFEHLALIDNDVHACRTLKRNFPRAKVIRVDLRKLANLSRFQGIDLLAAGLPCPPFSVAGKQLGAADERNLFPAAIEIIRETRPRAVMIENVAGFVGPKFAAYREHVVGQFEKLGYVVEYRLLDAADFGVPQRRKRVVIVALKPRYAAHFEWPTPQQRAAPTVGDALHEMMAGNRWRGAGLWAQRADTVAPTIVGGSKKHGGADLGPKGARKAWAKLGVEGKSLADDAPTKNFSGMPRLTVPMVARLQGFPEGYEFEGSKTHVYRQVGNAFPAPVAKAVARQIRRALATARHASPVIQLPLSYQRSSAPKFPAILGVKSGRTEVTDRT